MMIIVFVSYILLTHAKAPASPSTSIKMTSQIEEQPTYPEDSRTEKIYTNVWLIGTTITDASITASILFIFLPLTQKSPSHGLFKRLAFKTVASGLVTSIWATISFIIFRSVLGTSLIHVGWTYPLCQVYSLTMLVALNYRSIDPTTYQDRTSHALACLSLTPSIQLHQVRNTVQTDEEGDIKTLDSDHLQGASATIKRPEQAFHDYRIRGAF